MADADIRARISLDESQFVQGINKAKSSLNSFVSGNLKNVAGAAAAAFSVAAITSYAESIIELASNIGDLSIQTGVSAETLQKLGFAAKQNGSSIDEVAQGIKKLSVSLSSALGGNKDMIESFQKLGITVDDLKSKSVDQIFMQVADAVKNSTDPTLTMANVVSVLGRNASNLIPLLARGSDGIKKLGDDAKASGAIMSDSVIAEIKNMTDELERFKASSAGFAPLIASFLKGSKLAIDLTQLIGKLALAGGNVEKTMAAIKGFEDSGKIPEPQEDQKAKIARFSVDPEQAKKDKEAEDRAKHIAKLQEDIAEKKTQLARDQLSTEEKIREVGADANFLELKAAGEQDEEKRLETQNKILDLEKEIAALKKQSAQESEKAAADLDRDMKDKRNKAFDLAKIQAGRGIHLSAPITDSLARIGGFVGGSGDPKLRIAEKQMKIQEEIRNYVEDMLKILNPSQQQIDNALSNLG